MLSRQAFGLSARRFISSGAVAKQVQHNKLFINGEFVKSETGRTFPTICPATEEVITEVEYGGQADIDKAVDAATAAFPAWAELSGYARSQILWKMADLLEERKSEFAELETLDNGKPLFENNIVDVPLAIQMFRYYAGYCDKLHGKVIPHASVQFGYNVFNYTLHEPVGVTGGVIPWNFPLLMLAWKVAPALCCGNTMVLKPAEQTPLTALKFGQLCKDAGLPKGVLNIVTGYGDTGEMVSRHMGIDKVAFTGSTDTARSIQIAAAESNLKRLTLELGGKSPAIVLDDADIDHAVANQEIGIFFNQGQVCCASSRVYVHEKVYDEYLEKTVKKAEARVVGDPFAEGTTQGSQIDKDQFDKIMGYIDKGKKEGAKLETGGTRVHDKGYFVAPTIFSEVKEDMNIVKDEIFGPVMAISKFSDVDDAVKKANDSRFGLAAGVFTKNLGKAHTLVKKLRAGTVWVNCWNVFDAASPFGGYKMSGQGREMGEYALNSYTEVKSVVVNTDHQ